MIARSEVNVFSRWWWGIDRGLLFGTLCLFTIGVLISFAAAPPIAERLQLYTFFFTIRHGFFAVGGILIMIMLSFCKSPLIRRISLVLLVVSLTMMVIVLFNGEEIKGARRWIRLFGFSLQPSEFMKPALIVLSAWFFAESIRYQAVPGVFLGLLLLVLPVILLLQQPDIGQMIIICTVMSVLLVLAGLRLRWLIAITVAFVLLGSYVYETSSHVRMRIDNFFSNSSDLTYQTGRSLEAIASGGWYGRGPGEGQVKYYLPDAHTDYVFPVVVEEFGIVAALLLITLIGFVSIRGLYKAHLCPDPFSRLAATGLMTVFSIQALVNIGVSLNLLPPKGVTLPLISFGGSSLLAMAITMGFVLALTRKRSSDFYSCRQPQLNWQAIRGMR